MRLGVVSTYIGLLCALLMGCVGTSPVDRRFNSSAIATNAGWERATLATGTFKLAAFLPPYQLINETLTIYIEGDGLAWIDSTTPSFDPTPTKPLALRLAILDGHAAYLARPCQYVSEKDRQNCSNKYWTSHRFAPEVIDASNIAIDQLKARYSAKNLRLIGYSGGANVAALVSAKRNDVMQLVTVAGNLNHAAWTKRHRLSPLTGSINAADYWESLQAVPQQHYVGGRDTVITLDDTQSFINKFPDKKPNVSIMPTFDHHCCWVEIWPSIVKNKFNAINNPFHK